MLLKQWLMSVYGWLWILKILKSFIICGTTIKAYQLFWEECKKYLSRSIDIAADECWHDTVTHLATALSVRDLHKQVCPEGTPLPSEKWLFWPKDVTRRTAYQYTGRLEVKLMIQSWQFRHHHTDAQCNIPADYVVCISGYDFICILFLIGILESLQSWS